jgi:hypothetical protein
LSIHIACYYKASENIINLLFETHPISIKIQGDKGCLSIHSALRFNASETVIKMLFRAYLGASKIQDKQGCLPLHIASMHDNPSQEILLMLVEAYPESISIESNEG